MTIAAFWYYRNVSKNYNENALLSVKEMCSYLGIGQKNARELLSNPKNNFTICIGNRLYAHKEKLDEWLLNQIR